MSTAVDNICQSRSARWYRKGIDPDVAFEPLSRVATLYSQRINKKKEKKFTDLSHQDVLKLEDVNDNPSTETVNIPFGHAFVPDSYMAICNLSKTQASVSFDMKTDNSSDSVLPTWYRDSLSIVTVNGTMHTKVSPQKAGSIEITWGSILAAGLTVTQVQAGRSGRSVWFTATAVGLLKSLLDVTALKVQWLFDSPSLQDQTLLIAIDIRSQVFYGEITTYLDWNFQPTSENQEESDESTWVRL